MMETMGPDGSIGEAPDILGARVVFEPRPTALRSGHIYLGVAEPGRLQALDDGAALILNHRGADLGMLSTTRFVQSRPDADIEQWRATLELGREPAAPLAGTTLVVEDASPDTCLALAALARRLAGQSLPPTWVDYADRWEAGDVHSTGAPERSFGALESALVHPFFDTADPATSARALCKGMDYTLGLLGLGVDPADLPADLPLAAHAEAASRLAAEKDRYSEAVRAGTVVQLFLPTRGTGRRRALDAIILSELELTGATKIWLRRDSSSPTGRGYGLMALYRPRAIGAGGDMSVSVDPATSVHLRDLWCALEAREEAAWTAAGETRPRTNPRPLNVYREFRDCQATPCDQPWYDGGDLTLVAAPKALGVGGPLGSKLRWADVLDELWRAYRPDGEVRACPRADPARGAKLLDAAAREAAAGPVGGSPLRLVDLSHCADPSDLAVWTPSLERALAGCLAGAVPTIECLPAAADFDIFHERGGTVVVAAAGLVLYEQRSGLNFPAQGLNEAASRNAETLAKAIRMERRLEEATRRALLAVERGDGGHTRRALTCLYRMQMDAHAHIGEPAPAETDPLVARVGAAMQRRWGSRARFEAVLARTRELETMVRSATEARTAALLRRVTIYGFPALVFAAILGVVFEPLAGEHAQDVRMGVAFGALAAFVVLTAGFTFVSHLVVGRTDRAWSRDMHDPSHLADGGE